MYHGEFEVVGVSGVGVLREEVKGEGCGGGRLLVPVPRLV